MALKTQRPELRPTPPAAHRGREARADRARLFGRHLSIGLLATLVVTVLVALSGVLALENVGRGKDEVTEEHVLDLMAIAQLRYHFEQKVGTSHAYVLLGNPKLVDQMKRERAEFAARLKALRGNVDRQDIQSLLDAIAHEEAAHEEALWRFLAQSETGRLPELRRPFYRDLKPYQSRLDRSLDALLRAKRAMYEKALIGASARARRSLQLVGISTAACLIATLILGWGLRRRLVELYTSEREAVQHAEDAVRRAEQAAEQAEQAAQQAEEASRLKDEFLATLSHELRTPLNAMLGWLEMLRRSDLGEPKRQHGLEVVRRNAQRQAKLVDDLLDVSRIVSGKLLIEPVPVDIGAVVTAAVEVITPAAAAKAIEVSVQLPQDQATRRVLGDPARLQQVLWNLLANAVKFTPEQGQVTVEVSRPATEVLIEVTDSGPGIPAEFLPHVFDRFRQHDAGTRRAHGGLGLGLAIVRHLVELHGGSVEAMNGADGRGARFLVRLPVAAAVEYAGGRDTSTPPLGRANVAALEGLRVLIVDDDADARELLTEVLKQHGASVQAAARAEEALDAVARVAPDAIVSDIAMPGTDGYDFVGQLRRIKPWGSGKFPVVALTALTGSGAPERALAAGFSAHLSKPVDTERLVAVLASLSSPRRSSGAGTS